MSKVDYYMNKLDYNMIINQFKRKIIEVELALSSWSISSTIDFDYKSS